MSGFRIMTGSNILTALEQGEPVPMLHQFMFDIDLTADKIRRHHCLNYDRKAGAICLYGDRLEDLIILSGSLQKSVRMRQQRQQIQSQIQ